MKNENNVQHKASAAADKKHKEGNCILPPWQGGIKGGCENISESEKLSDNQQTSEILHNFPGLNAIGYREVIDYLAWIKTLPEAIESVQTNSRHYAKRQLTWFRRYGNDKIDWFFGS
jgi:hypothetical protein